MHGTQRCKNGAGQWVTFLIGLNQDIAPGTFISDRVYRIKLHASKPSGKQGIGCLNLYVTTLNFTQNYYVLPNGNLPLGSVNI